MGQNPLPGSIGLTVLPNELVDEISTLLDRPSVCALALACKHTNKSATDQLYKAYVNLEPPSKAPFHLFLRTICERPDLAQKVRRVEVRGWRSEYEVVTGAAWRGLTKPSKEEAVTKERTGPYYLNKDKSVRTTNADRFKMFVQAAVSSGLIADPHSHATQALKSSVVWYTSMRSEGDFLRLLARGVEDAHFILMAVLLPKLEALVIDGLSPYPLLDWFHFFSRSNTALRALHSLHIRGSITKETEPVVMSSLQYLDILPNLHILQLFNIAAAGHRFNVSTIPSQQLTCVDLFNSAMSLRLLRKLVDGQHLTRFTYMPGCREVQSTKANKLSTSDVFTRLSSSKPTLKRLGLFPISWPTEQASLKDFNQLLSLEGPHPGLLNIPPDDLDPEAIACALREQIPSTVATLTLRHLLLEPQLKTILEQLAHLKLQSILPSLKLIRLRFCHSMPSYAFSSFVVGPTGGFAGGVGGVAGWLPTPDVEPRVREDLGDLFKDAGLQMEISQTD